MQKSLSRKCISTLFLMSLSLPLCAETIDLSKKKELKLFLNTNVAQEVNHAVTPPKRECGDQNVGTPNSFRRYGFSQKNLEIKNIDVPQSTLLTRAKLMENYQKLGGDPIALTQSLCFFDKNKNANFKAAGDPSRSNGIKIDNQRYITINDLNVSMNTSRFFVLDMETGKVNTYFSAHGYGDAKGVPESGMQLEATSNIGGSNATPRGFFITGSRVNGSNDRKGPNGTPRWKFSMKLHGLQAGVNDNSFSRAIIVHPYPQMPPESASSDEPDIHGAVKSDGGPYSLSQGCTMLSEKYASDIINEVKAPSNSAGGSLYYNYSAEEKSRGPKYCGDEGLMKK